MNPRVPLFATIVVLALSSASCGLLEPEPPWAERQEELDRNRELWEDAGIVSYSYQLQRLCYCGGTGTFALTVADGVVTAAESEDGDTVPEAALQDLQTVDDLFDEVQRGVDRTAHGFEVEYHPELGYPTLVDLDPIEDAIDDEVTYRAENLVPLDGA